MRELKAEQMEKNFRDKLLFIPGVIVLLIMASACIPIAIYDLIKRRWKLFWLWRASRY